MKIPLFNRLIIDQFFTIGNVNGDRTCNECKDGFFELEATNGLGCKHCQCDVGGTQILNRGQMPICDKDSGNEKNDLIHECTLRYLVTVHVRLSIFKIFEPTMKKKFLKKQYFHKYF